MHHALSLGLLVALIAFAFGKQWAQSCVTGFLIGAGAVFLYVAVRIIMGTV